MLTRIDHVGIACRDLTERISFYEATFGLTVVSREVNEEQGVREAMLHVADGPAGSSYIQLLEPLAPDTPVGRFIARRGEGMHHIGYGVPDLSRGPGRARRHRRPADRRAPAARLHGRRGGLPASFGNGRRADRAGAGPGPVTILRPGRQEWPDGQNRAARFQAEGPDIRFEGVRRRGQSGIDGVRFHGTGREAAADPYRARAGPPLLHDDRDDGSASHLAHRS